jgi:hypothetical protein
MKELLLAADLDWSRQSPCGDCPFLKTSPFHEGVAKNLVSYFDTIDAGRFAHTCHKTDNRPSCDGPKNWNAALAQVCAGSVMMLLKTGQGKDLQIPLLQAAERGDLDLKEMTRRTHADDRVFTTWQMLAFYAKGVAEALAFRRTKAGDA